MVIDGGEPAYDEKRMKPVLQAVLKAHGKKTPGIAVCTHCDSDHIGCMQGHRMRHGCRLGNASGLMPS